MRHAVSLRSSQVLKSEDFHAEGFYGELRLQGTDVESYIKATGPHRSGPRGPSCTPGPASRVVRGRVTGPDAAARSPSPTPTKNGRMNRNNFWDLAGIFWDPYR